MYLSEVQLEEFPSHDPVYYSLAQEQLKILHSAGISHNELSRRNVLCIQYPQDGTRHVYLIDFGYSSMGNIVGQKDFSGGVSEYALNMSQRADIEDLGSLCYGCTSADISADENKSPGQS